MRSLSWPLTAGAILRALRRIQPAESYICFRSWREDLFKCFVFENVLMELDTERIRIGGSLSLELFQRWCRWESENRVLCTATIAAPRMTDRMWTWDSWAFQILVPVCVFLVYDGTLQSFGNYIHTSSGCHAWHISMNSDSTHDELKLKQPVTNWSMIINVCNPVSSFWPVSLFSLVICFSTCFFFFFVVMERC